MAFSIVIDDYVQRFHQLQGTTLGERYRAFNHYFQDVTASLTTSEDVQTFFDYLKPRNRLEEIFLLVLLLYYKQQKQLVAILCKEDSVLIKLLLKDATFVQDMIRDLDTKEFVEFLSKVSFVVRAKVITRLSKLPESFNNKLDGYYVALKEKYGLDVAKNLLSGCSLETITGELAKHRILLTNNQLTRIYERSNDFLETYFAHLKTSNHSDFRSFVKMIKMVALTNDELYWKLLKIYKFDSKLGYKHSLVVLRHNKEAVINDATKYLSSLNRRAVIDSLSSDEFALFYAHILPRTIDEFDVSNFGHLSDDLAFYLFKFTTKEKRFEMLQKVFRNKYNANLLEHEEFLDETILEFVPVKDRVDIIEKKLRKDPPQENYIAFYETDKALDILKKKISNTTDATKRMTYVESLIQVCKVNSDMKRFPEVLDYILKRHKNEDNSFYSVIFRSITDKCKLEKFDQAMWDTINGMIDAFKIRFKTFEYTLQTFEEAYMKFKVRNNISIEDDVSRIMTEAYKDHSWYRFWNDRPMMELCLDVAAVVIPKLFHGKKLGQAVNMYYNTVKEFNRQHRTGRIDIFKHAFIVKYWEEIVADDNSDKTCIFDDLTFMKGQPDLVTKITKLIWEGKRTENYQWRWFLKYQPQDIVANYEKFFENKNENRSGLRRFPYNVTYFSHLGIPELFCKKSVELLQTEGLPGHSHQYVAAVKLLVHHKEFVDVVQPLLPKDTSTIDLSRDQENYVEVRQAIARVIGGYKEKSKALDTLAVIAKGDYLQFALFSMHKIMYHTPEYKLKDFLDKIAEGSVSLRKHVLFILSGMSTVENVYETFKKIGQTEKNPSVRTYLLRTTLQYFQLNPSERFLELTKEHSKLLEPANVEGYTLLIDLKNTPMEYMSSYIEFVWRLIMANSDKEILELRYKLLGNINNTIMGQVNDDLLHKIVMKCLDFGKDDLQNVYEFVHQYIIDRKNENVGNRIELVVKQFPQEEITLNNAKAYKNVGAFISSFCKEIVRRKNDEESKDVDAYYTLILEELIKPSPAKTTFKSTIWLTLTKLYLDAQDHKTFIREFGHFYTETVNKLGLFVIHTLAEIFSDLVATITQEEKLNPQETLLDFLLQILDDDAKIQKELFVLLVLPKSVSKSENVLKKHLEVIRMLNRSNYDVAKTAMSCYLESVY